MSFEGDNAQCEYCGKTYTKDENEVVREAQQK